MVQTRNHSTQSEMARYNASHKHHDTPKKALIRAEYRAIDAIPFTNRRTTKVAIFERNGVSKTRGYAILASNTNSD
jgi:hypothetical protein